MLKMNHPHIVRCFDVFREWIDMEDPNNQIEEKGVVIIQELMGEGTLKRYHFEFHGLTITLLLVLLRRIS